MAFNIKSDETHRIAREVADLAGESMAKAVDVALRERREKLARRDRGSRIVQCAREARAHASPEWLGRSMADFDADLYDEETGLPR